MLGLLKSSWKQQIIWKRQLLGVKNDSFNPCKNGEKLLSLEVVYLSVIGVLCILSIIYA